jgi:hypothetical protein
MNEIISAGRREFLGSGLVAAVALVHARAAGTAPMSGSKEFDFLLGRWRVAHSKLRLRLKGSRDWYAFPGMLHVRTILGGLGDIDENLLEDPAGSYSASSLRLFDPKSGEWSVYWIDGRTGGIDKPVVGSFNGRTGRFYNDDAYEGRPVRVRFTYEDLAPGRARWAQAFSPDAGRTWETNWTMDFFRVGTD